MTKLQSTFELTVTLFVQGENMSDAIGAIENRLTSGRTDASVPASDDRQVLLKQITGKAGRGR